MESVGNIDYSDDKVDPDLQSAFGEGLLIKDGI